MCVHHTFDRICWICDDHVIVSGNFEDLTVPDGVNVGKLSQLLEIWAHQYFHLRHIRLLNLQNTHLVESFLALLPL